MSDRRLRALLIMFPAGFRERFGPELLEGWKADLARSDRPAWTWGRLLADAMRNGLAERRVALMSRKTVARGSGGPNVTVVDVPTKRPPLRPDQLAVSRRQFLNRAWIASMSTFLGFVGMGSLSFLWPKLTGGFGTKIVAGDLNTLLESVGPKAGFKPMFFPEGRFWLTYYEGTGDASVYAASGVLETNLQALYRKCVHLGCSVPHCDTSMLFECPCHGSKYKLTGEWHEGPAPRGLDRFPVSVDPGGKVVVDTGTVLTGPPRGTSTWPKFSGPVGPLCAPRAG